MLASSGRGEFLVESGCPLQGGALPQRSTACCITLRRDGAGGDFGKKAKLWLFGHAEDLFRYAFDAA